MPGRQRATSSESPCTGLNPISNLDFRTSTDEYSALRRDAAAHFDRYDRSILPSVLACTALDWGLSSDESRMQHDNTFSREGVGLDGAEEILMMFPCDWECDIELCEMQQIMHELVMGIYALNQVPALSMETSHDHSTACDLAPAYEDTRVGQIMIEVDYFMKSLWSGYYFPPDKRVKFNDRWRYAVDLDHITGEPHTGRSFEVIWCEAGLVDMSQQEECRSAYENLAKDHSRLLAGQQDNIMKQADKLSVSIHLYQRSCKQSKNLFVGDSSYNVNCALVHPQMDQPDEQMLKFLKLYQKFISDNLEINDAIRKKVEWLKIISFLVPLLISLKKTHNVIPQMKNTQFPFPRAECRTSKELPPIVFSSSGWSTPFAVSNMYHGLYGGVYFDRNGPRESVPVSSEISDSYENVARIWRSFTDGSSTFSTTIDGKLKSLPRVVVGDRGYLVFGFKLDQFYGLQPKLPRWIEVYTQEIERLLPIKLPLSENQIHERLRRRFGYERTLRLKAPQSTLPVTVSSGLVDVALTLSRRQLGCVASLHDHQGFSLLHYAAMMNRTFIIVHLIQSGCDIDVRRNERATSLGVTPLHLAARCGAAEGLACLMSFHADVTSVDANGYSAVHYAAVYNNADCIRVLLRSSAKLKESRTVDEDCMTPVLLAAMYGATDVVQYLLAFGINIAAKDDHGRSVVHLASLNGHTDLLELFLKLRFSHVDVWATLVEMLCSPDVEYKEKAARCMECLTTDHPDNWEPLLDALAIPALIDLLGSEEDHLQALSASIFCNISQYEMVCTAITREDPLPLMISRLLTSNWDTLQSRICVIFADLARDDRIQEELVEQGCIEPVVSLLESTVDHVLVNAANLLRMLADGNVRNQSKIGAAVNVVKSLDRMLELNSHRVQANAAAFIGVLAERHPVNQNRFLEFNLVDRLVLLLKSKSSMCQMKAAAALQVLADHNHEVQMKVDWKKATHSLIRMLKMWDMETKEQGAMTLWSLAGDSRAGQISIASAISVRLLVDMLMTKSSVLQLIACQAIIALAKDDIDSQKEVVSMGCVVVLMALLKQHQPRPSEQIVLMAVRALGCLCLDIAHQPNPVTQKEAMEVNAVPVLVRLMHNTKDPLVQVEIAITLANLSLAFRPCRMVLARDRSFSVACVLGLMQVDDALVRSKASTALSTLSYKNKSMVQAVCSVGGVPRMFFDDFLDCGDEILRAQAAFDAVIIMDAVVTQDRIGFTTQCIELLSRDLCCGDAHIMAVAANLVASLATLSAGIPDALVEAGVVDHLVDAMATDDVHVVINAAVAIGFFSAHPVAMRQLLTACRNTPWLYRKISSHLKTGHLSMTFVKEWEHQVEIGIPCHSLVINGGPSPHTGKQQQPRHAPTDGQRPKTTTGTRRGPPPALPARSQSARGRSRAIRE